MAVRPGLGGSSGSPLAGAGAPEAEAGFGSNGRRGPPDVLYGRWGLTEWSLASIHNQPHRA